MIKKIITLVCLSFGIVLADAIQITEENDFFRGNDNQYTQGSNISYVKPSVVDGEFQREIYGASQKIYAPDNKETTLNQPKDRPYCATLTGVYEIWTKSGNETIRQTFEVGVLGPAAMGEQAQNGVHRMIRNDLAMGWDNQLKNEPVANYYHERYHPFYKSKDGKWEFNIEGIYGGTAGTEFANAFGGSKMMFGYNLPQYKVLGGIYPKISKDGKIDNETEWFFYGFFQSKVYTVAHDATLGNSIINGEQSDITPCPIVGESIYGVTVGWNYISVSYAIGNRTKQFYEQNGTYDYGTIILTIGTLF